MEGLGFWIFIGLLLLAVITASSREKIERQRTLQRLIERNEPIDEDLINRVLGRPRILGPGGVYRALRAVGAFVMVTAFALGVIAVMIRVSEGASMFVAVRFGIFFCVLPFTMGLGMFIASRFCDRPDQAGQNT